MIRHTRRSTHILTVVVLTLGELAIGLVVLRLILLSVAPFTNSPESVRRAEALITGGIFHNPYARLGWADMLSALGRSSLLVGMAFVWSGLATMVTGYALAGRPHARRWDALSGLIGLGSAVPLFAVCLTLYAWFRAAETQHGEPGTLTVGAVLAAAFVLGSGEGMLADWMRHFETRFHALRRSTYFLSRLTRGQNPLPLAWRHIRPFVMQGLATRLSFFFGSLIIVERILDIRGLGWTFIDAIKSDGHPDSYQRAMVSGFLILAVPLIAHAVLRLRDRAVPDSPTG